MAEWCEREAWVNELVGAMIATLEGLTGSRA